MRRFELFLIVICLTVTVGLFANSVNNNNDGARDEFLSLTDESIDAVRDRMRTYLQNLNGAAAFLNTADRVSVEDFAGYVDTLEIEQFLPGIAGIGLIEPVARGEEAAFIERMRALGETRLQIKPDTGAEERFIISRISPYQPNKEALGLDITFEKGRREAAIRARETGMPQLTPRITLVQDDFEAPGFLLLRPFFRIERSTPDAEPEQGEFVGWVYAPFVGPNVLAGATPNEGRIFNFSVYDGDTVDPANLIYGGATREAGAQQSLFTSTYVIDSFGRNWTLVYESTPAFERSYRTYVPLAILLVGALSTAMLLFSMRNLRIRSEALSEVAAMRARQVSAREEENRAIVENAVVAVFILDDQSRVMFANQAALSCFGYGLSEMDGMGFDQFIKPVPDDSGAEDYNATGMTRRGAHLVLDVQRNDWLTFDGAARTTAIVRDLTAEHKAQRELRRTKRLYDLALEGARIGVFDLNLKDGTSDVSDTWCDLMGYGPGCNGLETQRMFLERVHPNDMHILTRADKGAIDGTTERSIAEYRVRFGENEWRWMRSDSVVVARDAAGTATRMIGAQTDVTDLRHSRNALEVSEKRFRRVLAAAPVGMALMNEEWHFTDVNGAFSTLCGWAEKDLTAGAARLSDMMPPEDLAALEHKVADMVRAKAQNSYQGEHRILHRDGFERWGLFNISWAYDKNEGRNMFIAQINDITDQKKLDQIKNEFVSTVSHELRTPLTSIKGALGLIHASEASGLTPASQRLIDIARTNTDRLTTIVNDILDLEKISSGDVQFDFETVDMVQIIQDTVQEMLPFAETHANTLKIDAPEAPVMVQADQGRTRQVLANLISNACKYSFENTEILVKTERLDNLAIVYVQNTGIGVPESFKSRIFQAFSQADGSDTRAKGGTGLGLNITRQIVNRHNGQIGFKSVANGVTVFWFTYPIARTVLKSVPAQELPEEQKHAKKKLRVLHLEDDLDFAEILQSGLRDVARITHVETLAAARVAIGTMKPDVIIIDWSLPDGNGEQLLDEIYQKLPDVRVLGLSADSDVRGDDRLFANLVKSRTELSTIAACVAGRTAKAS
ncbi:CHASE domain-containing protein [Sulfitobacter sp. JB4-11]|uniref:CHASE domain-containing protein n=1 Tax=Sulfitobacter rhodophyticola TaxID=3238304 RepID=UPI0035167688